MFNVTTISTIIRTAGIVATTAGRGDIDMVAGGVVQRD